MLQWKGFVKVTCEWVCKRERAVSYRLVKQLDGSRSVSFVKSLCHLSSGYPSHWTLPELKNVVSQKRFKVRKGDEFIRDIAIEASLAAESAAELPLMPTWPRTQTKPISLSSWNNREYSSGILIETGWSYFQLCIAWSAERESDEIKKDFCLEL